MVPLFSCEHGIGVGFTSPKLAISFLLALPLTMAPHGKKDSATRSSSFGIVEDNDDDNHHHQAGVDWNYRRTNAAAHTATTWTRLAEGDDEDEEEELGLLLAERDIVILSEGPITSSPPARRQHSFWSSCLGMLGLSQVFLVLLLVIWQPRLLRLPNLLLRPSTDPASSGLVQAEGEMGGELAAGAGDITPSTTSGQVRVAPTRLPHRAPKPSASDATPGFSPALSPPLDDNTGNQTSTMKTIYESQNLSNNNSTAPLVPSILLPPSNLSQPATAPSPGTAPTQLVPHIPVLPPVNNSTHKTVVVDTCQYQKGLGTFIGADKGRSRKWAHQNPEQCPVQDYLNLWQHVLKPSPPMAFLLVGSSVDRNMVQFFCDASEKYGFSFLPYLWERNTTLDPAIYNQANNRKNNVIICTNGHLTLIHFKIFGMSYACSSGGEDVKVDSRFVNSTAERVQRFLPLEVFDVVPPRTIAAVMIGSALWDMSQGCTDHARVTPVYEQAYRQGMIDLARTLRAPDMLTDKVPLYWRTSPPISLAYDNYTTSHDWGRNRHNQQVLNQALRETVEQYQLGTVMDWWQQIKGSLTEQQIGASLMTVKDGVHYGVPKSLAFLNLFWQTFFYQYPEYKQQAGLIHGEGGGNNR